MSIVVAYFDPGSGSLLLQAILGGAAGLLVFAKFLWESVWPRFRRKKQESGPPADDAEPK